MEERKRITRMNDREYKRFKARRNKKLALKNRVRMFLMIFAVVLTFSFAYQTLKTSANTGEDMKYKYYTVISVSENDTLWDIADRYIDYDFYSNREAYIREVVKINHLADASGIVNGQKLTIPYYSEVFVR